MIINDEILQNLGPTAAAIHGVLMARDNGNGVEITYQEIGKLIKASEATVKRNIPDLLDQDYVKRENWYDPSEGRRHFHYRIPTWSVPDPRGHFDLPKRGSSFLDIDREEKTRSEVGSSTSTSTSSSSSSSLDLSKDDNTLGKVAAPAWVPRGTPMPQFPKPKFGQKNIMVVHREALWLVSYFEGYVLDRKNQENLAKGWKQQDAISDKKKLRWLDDAERLLSRRRKLTEVVEVIDRIFSDWGGMTPFDVISRHGLQCREEERKVTRIRQVLDNYDELRYWVAVAMAPEPEYERRSRERTPEEQEEFRRRLRNHR